MKSDIELPRAFLERLHTIFPQSGVSAILEGYAADRPISIRLNTVFTSDKEETLLQSLKNLGFLLEKVLWLPHAYTVQGATIRQLTDLSLYKEGAFYIQSLSSMIPALVLDPQPGETVLDMAAAPGSKTTQLAAMMSNKGTIIANDPSRERLFKLKQNLENQGVKNTELTSEDGQSLWKKYPEYFDKVLLDAPCSMEGTFLRSKPASFSFWSPKKIKLLSKQQKWLLRSAVSCTKPGGTIVYSTCTLSPEENEEVVSWILEKESSTIQLEEISIQSPERYPSFLTYKNGSFPKDITKTLRILPSRQMEGFFVAKIRKIASNIHNLHS